MCIISLVFLTPSETAMVLNLEHNNQACNIGCGAQMKQKNHLLRSMCCLSKLTWDKQQVIVESVCQPAQTGTKDTQSLPFHGLSTGTL